eukprot:COSAG03_NODE_1254_length_4466_cov_6.795054_6_plen_127_part_00
MRDCMDAMRSATESNPNLVTVQPAAPMRHWPGTTIGRGVKSLVHRDRDSTWTYLVTPLQDLDSRYDSPARATFQFVELGWRVPFHPGVCVFYLASEVLSLSLPLSNSLRLPLSNSLSLTLTLTLSN